MGAPVPGKPPILKLIRLERVMDMVYALAIWRLFMLLPRPEGDEFAVANVGSVLVAHWDVFVIAALGTLIVVVYWWQNNDLLGHLERTDGRHTALSVAQLFAVLLFLYSIGIGLRVGADPISRVFESGCALLVGVMSLAAWRYAIGRGGLLREGTDPAEVERLSRRSLSEPLTAAITIPFAFAGPWLWELSWLIYPFLRYLLGGRGKGG